MIGRLAMVALAVALASCAGLEPAGRNAQRTRPSPAASAPPAPAPQMATAPQPAPQFTAPPAARQTAPVPAAEPPARQSAPVTANPPPQQTAPPVAAAQIAAPPPSQPARARSDDDDIIVPGQVQTQVPPPTGDPRSNEERRADVRAWDQCLTQVQGAFDSDPMRPQLTTPEEYCSQSLGMSERTSVPISRQQRRR